MIKVTCEVEVCEADGQEIRGLRPFLEVQSHWNRRALVRIKTPKGEDITVLASDLVAAIVNATNTARF